ncbi:MAG: GIY-YIG nuclease family protein [Mesonia sp.]|uniref:GIY-YIG nuclease family protein n=1 Tax=Mesonia sp. TaxID=1960830 RepID=UPI003F9E9AE9
MEYTLSCSVNHTVYILFSKKLDRFYIGETADFNMRMIFHKQSLGNKFTGKAKDWELYLKFECDCKKQAQAIERHIKKMKSKIYISNLKKYGEIILKLKNRYAC